MNIHINKPESYGFNTSISHLQYYLHVTFFQLLIPKAMVLGILFLISVILLTGFKIIVGCVL